MFTPILNPNSSSSSTNTKSNSAISLSQYQSELSKILHKHDPNAIRLYDFINHVKIFTYNLNTSRWGDNPIIEGNLFVYKRQEIINNHPYQSYVFSIINKEQIFIQSITSGMLEQIDKQCLFYEVMKNDKPEIFSLHFLNEQECLRLHKFIYHCIQKLKEQQSLSITTGAHQLLTPVTNSNEDPTLSLKRLLNISSQNELSLPPSEFKQSKPMNREHFQNVFLHLIQNNDEFLDIIHQACFSSST
ncbi:unnamed protein product [Adineta steineri]|uniref:mRNA-decapping enzyme C-terminal domain-containing protein n=1 Tax=Adineta steineri TaxID=433720 RepID=A0A815H1N8_9BILA|nr:unnamed protein product [Adineta steineri]CAF1345188.1 unnamed protein product [Adineta steineri]